MCIRDRNAAAQRAARFLTKKSTFAAVSISSFVVALSVVHARCRSGGLGAAALFEVDEENLHVAGAQAGDARRLAERARADLRQFFAAFMGKGADSGIVHVIGNC